jgi:DNA-binding XRE family transcriptional regulator
MTNAPKDWLDSVIERKMKNPEFRETWEDLELEYTLLEELITQMTTLRKEQGMTQTELAEKLATTQAAISRIESGKQNITLAYAEEIARALGKKIKITFE